MKINAVNQQLMAQSERAQLEKQLLDLREALRQFRFKTAQSKIKNVKEGRELRRNIARILTKLNRA